MCYKFIVYIDIYIIKVIINEDMTILKKSLF